jgi:hypothetical protein
MQYKLRITLTEDLLASSPANKDVYKQFIESKAREQKPDELETLPADSREEIGWSVFHSDQEGILLFEYHLKGFIKEAAQAVVGKSGLTAFKSKIDRWMFVRPRTLHLMNPDGTPVMERHGVVERPIRAMTMQGPRVSLKRSDMVKSGVYFDAIIEVLELGEKELNEGLIRKCLDYGKYCGLGEWRGGGYGRFRYELERS